MVGRGVEPHIVLEQTLCEFDPVLPYSSGSVAEFVVHNPTPNPVEFYSLDFDKDYTTEEEASAETISEIVYIMVVSFLCRSWCT